MWEGLLKRVKMANFSPNVKYDKGTVVRLVVCEGQTDPGGHKSFISIRQAYLSPIATLSLGAPL